MNRIGSKNCPCVLIFYFVLSSKLRKVAYIICVLFTHTSSTCHGWNTGALRRPSYWRPNLAIACSPSDAGEIDIMIDWNDKPMADCRHYM